MSDLRTDTITVTDKNGRRLDAQVILCSDCGHDGFRLFTVAGHQHLECLECHTSYCDNSCGATTVAH